MATTTAPASISQFFRKLAEINVLSTGTVRIIRKLGKALGLLEEDGVTLDHWQLVIDDPYVAGRVAQLLDLHLKSPYRSWFDSLSEDQKFQPRNWSISILKVPVLTAWSESRPVWDVKTIGLIDGWWDDHFWDLPGMSAQSLNEIDAKMQLLGYKAMKRD